MIDVTKIGKVSDKLQSLQRWEIKIWWTLVHQHKSYRCSCWCTENQLPAQFWTTSYFVGQYLRYRKSENCYNPSHAGR